MTDRTFQQHALGFGASPAQVVFQINGNTVFQGSVTTLDEPIPTLPNSEYVVDNVAWSWTNPVDFEGTQQVTITVSGSTLLLAQTWANNPARDPDNFRFFYSVEVDGVVYADPFTEEAINGVSQSGPYNPAIPGQWWWQIPAGSTFTATMHVSAPSLADPDPETPPE